MPNAWAWWIVVVCTEDWWTLYHSTKIVRACSSSEAEKKALKPEDSHYFATDIIGPLEEKPGHKQM